MKSIKIVAANLPAIQAALDTANGRSHEHTITNAADVISTAVAYEKQLLQIVGAKKYAQGAVAVFESGGRVANAYKYSRTGTRLTLRRGAGDWYLDAVTTCTIYAKGGNDTLTLTAEQDAAAIAHLRSGYRIQPK